MAIQFQQNYQLLELTPADNWETASKNYRRLVNVWHPDRFTDRPRERIHAQQQFIELTKAFNNLRTFYRKNHRLPYEQIKQAIADSPEPASHQRVSPADKTVFEKGILNKRKPSLLKRKSRFLKPLLWGLPVGATIAAGMLVFVIVDRNAKLNTIEEAKRVLRNAEPSEYMRDSTEISKANSRTLLLNSTSGGGKMGDKLARDVFK